MSDKWPAANGNWSTAANWNGGTVPVNGDVVYCDGKVITFDVDVSQPLTTIRSDRRSGGTVGGSVVVPASRSVTMLQWITGSYLLFSGVGSGATIGGDIYGGSGVPGRAMEFSATLLAIVGDVYGGSGGASGSHNSTGVYNSGSGVINITGSVFGGSGNGGFGAMITAGGTINISGNSTGGAAGAGSYSNGSGIINVTGNAVAGSNAAGCFNASSGTITVGGNATGGAGSGSNGVYNQSTGTITVGGNATGGSVNGQSYGARNDSTGTLRVVGTAIASTTCPAVYGGNIGGTTIVGAATQVSNGRQALDGFVKFKNSGPRVTVILESGASKLMVPTDETPDPPSQSNVRSGTVYHFGTLTGTAYIPAASSVAAGVNVDATVGTAYITSALAQSALAAALAAYETDGVASQDDLALVSVDLSGVIGYLTAIAAMLPSTPKLAGSADSSGAAELNTETLRRFVTEDTGETAAANGSVAKLAQGSGGGSGGGLTEGQQAQLNSIEAKTNLITSGTRITIAETSGSSITLKCGDDYYESTAKRIEITDADSSLYDLLRDETLTARAFGAGIRRDAVTGTFSRDTITHTEASGSIPAYTTIFVECSVASDTPAGVTTYDIQITNADGRKHTPFSGQVTLVQDFKS